MSVVYWAKAVFLEAGESNGAGSVVGNVKK